MKLKKLFVSLLAVVMLLGAAVAPVSAATSEPIEYENDAMLSMYWAPHVSHKRKGKMTVSTDVPYSSSKTSMCVEYDVEKLGWGIWYYTILEPDKVEYASHITFVAKADQTLDLTIGIVQKDLGFGGDKSGAIAKLSTEWQRFTFPLSSFKSGDLDLMESLKKELWISNISLGVNNTTENFVPVGKYWIDDIAFVDEADISKLPKVEGGKTPDTTTKKPDTTTKKPDTTTKKPDTTTTGKDNGATTTTENGGTDNSTTTLDGDVTTTTAADGVTADPTGALQVLDSLIKLDGDKLTVPEGMTVSNVLSRLKAEDGCEMAIVKDGAALEATEKIADGMSLVVKKDGAELKSYALDLAAAADGDGANNGWVLPVCIAAAVLLIAGVLLFVFRDKIFKKAN